MTKTNHIYALKWTREDGSCRGYQYDLPKGCISGAWQHIQGELSLCNNGFHATTLLGVNEWRGIGGYTMGHNDITTPCGRLWIVELGGNIQSIDAENKLAASSIRFIKELKYGTRYNKNEGECTVRVNDLKSTILNTKYKVLSSVYKLEGEFSVYANFDEINKLVTYVK
ncbi:MAG: hypothetical protein M0R17_03450 [Candidatus Omnitrophica bacterium]|jgi:hypothetical protein|nr:hypothetical protein [Candidatus Omnitrophota bacterium]